jgi:hypothetical protein
VQERVLLPDIDGDGRADYCTIADNGDIHCWRNGGQGKSWRVHACVRSRLNVT